MGIKSFLLVIYKNLKVETIPLRLERFQLPMPLPLSLRISPALFTLPRHCSLSFSRCRYARLAAKATTKLVWQANFAEQHIRELRILCYSLSLFLYLSN